MKRIFLSTIIVLGLTGCTQSPDLTFHATFAPRVESARVADLAAAAERMIERRVQAMNGTVKDHKVTLSGSGATGADIHVVLSTASLAAPLKAQLAEQFSFKLMRQALPGEKPDLTLEEAGGFMETGISQDDILWMTAAKDAKGQGLVQILFTKDGQVKVKAILGASKGKKLAIVVRNHLVSSFAGNGIAKENIIIEGIPQPEIAGIFADDVNVGSLVHFTAK